jgi:hypothetical protein
VCDKRKKTASNSQFGEKVAQQDETVSSLVSCVSPPIEGTNRKVLTIGQVELHARTFVHVWREKRKTPFFPFFLSTFSTHSLEDEEKNERKIDDN